MCHVLVGFSLVPTVKEFRQGECSFGTTPLWIAHTSREENELWLWGPKYAIVCFGYMCKCSHAQQDSSGYIAAGDRTSLARLLVRHNVTLFGSATFLESLHSDVATNQSIRKEASDLRAANHTTLFCAGFQTHFTVIYRPWTQEAWYSKPIWSAELVCVQFFFKPTCVVSSTKQLT